VREREDPLKGTGANLESPFLNEEIRQVESEGEPDSFEPAESESDPRTRPGEWHLEAAEPEAESGDDHEHDEQFASDYQASGEELLLGIETSEPGAENTGSSLLVAEDEAPAPTTLRMRQEPSSPVIARILWPALGFPAVIAPRANGSKDPLEVDATRCICVLILSNKPHITKEEAARYLRIVPWDKRTTRYIPEGQAGSFPVDSIQVRNDATRNQLSMPQKDKLADAVVFGGDRREKDNKSIVVSLARRVRDFYKKQKLGHLHEIRVSEEECAKLRGDKYHLFWNSEAPPKLQDAPSNEMQMLLDYFAKPRRKGLGAKWAKQFGFFLDEYKYDYGALHPPYDDVDKQKRLTEVLHPVFVKRQQGSLRIAHVTDTHVDVRADVYEANLKLSKDKDVVWDGANLFYKGTPVSYNNFNKSFVEIYNEAKKNSDIILLTGDLIDYGRGHVGLTYKGAFRKNLGDDDAYHSDRNWFLFYYLLASGDSYKCPSYTILGNHDWRMTPYPPFAPGAPNPRLLVHNSKDFKEDPPLKNVLKIAHDRGHEKGYAYLFPTNSILSVLFRSVAKAIKSWDKTKLQLDSAGSPLHTTVESVAWYLLLINPFLDYAFELPSGQQVLMLDWAENEEVMNEFEPRTFMGFGQRANDSLSPLQKWHVDEFADLAGKAKVIGIHAPPMGPYPNWSDTELLNGVKIYDRTGDSRAKKPDRTIVNLTRHTLFAIRPKDGPFGVAADYGSIVQHRDWFVERVANQKSNIRAVLSGHIHRNGLLVAHFMAAEKVWLMRAVNYKESRGIKPPGVATLPNSPARFTGPLYVNTTSAGPRGNHYEAGHRNVSPGFAIVSLASDGTIDNVSVRQIIPPQLPAPKARATGAP
jgi:Calcineurin-like phosphoesterase